MLDLTVPMVEVWLAGAKLGEYASDLEALKAAAAHADTLTANAPVDVEYEIRREAMKYIVHRRIVGPDAPALGPVLTISSTELTLTLDRPASGPTQIDRYEIEQLVGSTWTQIASGIGIFGATDEYAVTGLTASTSYSFRCRAVDTTERASEYSYSSGVTSAGVTNTAPVWVSGTLTKTVQAGSSTTINPADCADAEGDQITFTLIDTNPNDATISVSAGGIIQTTAATTVGTNAIVVRASDGLLTANKTIQLTVTAAATGNTFTIPQGTVAYNASAVQPGDTIIIEADSSGNRGPLKISNAVGTSGSRIYIKNPTTKRVNIGASGVSSFVFELDSCRYVTVDGSNYGGETYGINTTRPTSSTTGVTCFMKFTGLCQYVTLRYFEIDGKATSYGGGGVPNGLQAHDNTYSRTTHAGDWWEGHIVEAFYIHNVVGEGIYCGANFTTGAIPMRNITVRNGLITSTGRDGIQVKGWWSGTNSIHDLTITRCGRNSPDEAGQRFGISVLSGQADVYDNVITDCGESGIQVYVQSGPDEGTTYTGYGSFSNFTCAVYNNVVARSGQINVAPVNVGHGVTIGADGAARVPPLVSVYNNTLVSNEGYGVALNVNASSSCVVQNNILLDNGSGSTSNGPGATINNNLTTGAQSTVFVAPESDNYNLASEQAVTAGLTSATDIEGASRAGTASKGAYEYA